MNASKRCQAGLAQSNRLSAGDVAVLDRLQMMKMSSPQINEWNVLLLLRANTVSSAGGSVKNGLGPFSIIRSARINIGRTPPPVAITTRGVHNGKVSVRDFFLFFGKKCPFYEYSVRQTSKSTKFVSCQICSRVTRPTSNYRIVTRSTLVGPQVIEYEIYITDHINTREAIVLVDIKGAGRNY